MCGLAGIRTDYPIGRREERLRRMLTVIRHRGPDQAGIYLDDRVALGHVRLSILDLEGGQQPIGNEDETIWIVFNGEVYNERSLRADMLARGHRFQTHSDTEVLIHLYEEFGPEFVSRLNGQFAFAIWDSCRHLLLLGRDRLGVRPLYYALAGQTLVFGSEIKAILASGLVKAELDPIALDQTFTFWSTLSPRSSFRGIVDVPPGETMLFQDGRVSHNTYWRLSFPATEAVPAGRKMKDYQAELADLLIDATRIRLRADVPVGAYLSGGLDSSATASIISRYTDTKLDTFSIAFEDSAYDEGAYQQQMSRFLGTAHHIVRAGNADIGRVFPDVVWHIEMPVMRTSPAPMFLLSGLVRESNYKVVVTGEGADEFLGGYNIFKEDKIRRFWARQPDSSIRPLLFQRLYPYIGALNRVGEATLASFFGQDFLDADAPGYSHLVRWRNTSRAKRFFSRDLQACLADMYGRDHNLMEDVAYAPEFMTWHSLNRAQYLEITIFLRQYLLSAQGDRVGMAHSIEGRFPFLDHRVVEFCNALPPHLKLRGLTEKFLLRKTAEPWLPPEIRQRPKQAYRAPILAGFFNHDTQPYVRELLSEGPLRRTGLFNPAAVGRLVAKIDEDGKLGETDNMALAGILSTQLLYHQFIEAFPKPEPLPTLDKFITRTRSVDSFEAVVGDGQAA